jgi:hypothetical protein
MDHAPVDANHAPESLGESVHPSGYGRVDAGSSIEAAPATVNVDYSTSPAQGLEGLPLPGAGMDVDIVSHEEDQRAMESDLRALLAVHIVED